MSPKHALQSLVYHILQRFSASRERSEMVLDDDFYSPVNNRPFLDKNRDLWESPIDPVCIDWNMPTQIETAKQVARFVSELHDIPATAPPGQYCWKNPFWNNADALVQYGLVRHYQPCRYVEIGCGYSSLLLERAIEENDIGCQVTLIEPHPTQPVLEHLQKKWRFHRSVLQRAPLSIFEDLDEGDILFYDGSHCSKAGSDVNWFFFRVLPILRANVLVHIHDIFFPWDYPREWIFDRQQSWNEQYLLQAFLMHNEAYRVLIANRYLWCHQRELLDKLYMGVQPSHGCSFWMTKSDCD